MRNRRRHRAVFAVAAAYNIAWGAWVALDPDALYRFMGVPVPTHPEVAACLGMVIGLYGVVYLDIAREPEHGLVTAAVGLAGKIIGPLALVVNIIAGAWPPSALKVVVLNDLIWWLPFAAYLRDASSIRGSNARARHADPPGVVRATRGSRPVPQE